jgi:hypothetical protein
METRINNKFDSYIHEFKSSIIDVVKNQCLEQSQMENIIQIVYDYEKFKLTKDDFTKRKRVKNTIPLHDRCCAKRASGEQCTRRKKDDCDYCGTHEKGRPHGIVSKDGTSAPTQIKREIWAQEIRGIVYYIDSELNVYNTEDVISNIQNPKVIAKYVKQGDVYSIPEFNI